MISKEEVQKMAALARISATTDEIIALQKDFSDILGYVSDIQKMTTVDHKSEITGPVYNILRDDGEPHKSGAYTDALIDAATNSKERYIKVKKIIT